MERTRYHRRFVKLIKPEPEAQQILYQNMYCNIEAALSIGILPWYGWRMQVLKSIYDAWICNNQSCIPDYIIDHVNDAMREVSVNAFKYPDIRSIEKLLEFAKQILFDHEYHNLVNLFESNTTTRFAYVKTSLHKQCDVNANADQHSAEIYKSCLHYNCSILLNVLENTVNIFELKQEEIRLITYYSCECILREPLYTPKFNTLCRLGIDDTNKTVAVYDFWSWQYRQRNSGYKNFLLKFSEFVGDSPKWIIVPRYDLFEYYELSHVVILEYSPRANAYKTLNALIDECIKRYDYKPTWPIHDYTSDYILHRMISGKFRFYERETPLRMSYCDKNVFACSHNPMDCKRFKNRHVPSSQGVMHIGVCDPECLEKISRIESERLRRIVHKKRPKIRCEGLRRMLGLWIWDYCQAHKGKSVQNAIQAVTATHFPEENPHWKQNEHNESKDGEVWASYRERLLDERQLYHDYQEACRCVEAGEFLAKRTN